MPICLECKEEKEKVYHTGPFKEVCYTCRGRISAREWNRKNPERNRERSLKSQQLLRERVAALKLELGCTDCGYNTHSVALDFDHTNGKTKDISKLRSWKKVLQEIENHDCVVRCANCHRVKGLKNGDFKPD